jgi:adenosylcobinamide kinase/adenosylcobinamide-phosphate guanylyltransferase
MAARIAHHREHRPAEWQTIEEATDLAARLRALCAPDRLVLVDCLTLWLTNLMFPAGQEQPEVGPVVLARQFLDERAALLEWLDTPADGDVIFVANEIGLGVVPFGAVSRAFVDEAGRLNQAVAARCDRVLLVAAGLPLALKGPPCQLQQ